MSRTPVRSLLLALVAALVLAGCGGDDGGSSAGDPEDADVSLVGRDDLTFDQETLEADAGEITIALTCEEGVNHDVTIEDTGETVVECAAGESATGTVELEAGEYTYYCSVPGHEQTMRGTLTVS